MGGGGGYSHGPPVGVSVRGERNRTRAKGEYGVSARRVEMKRRLRRGPVRTAQDPAQAAWVQSSRRVPARYSAKKNWGKSMHWCAHRRCRRNLG